MKKSIILLAIVFFSCNTSMKNEFVFKASLTGFTDSTQVVLLNIDDHKVVDTTYLVKNTFKISGTLENPFFARILLGDKEKIMIDFWIENGTLQLESDKNSLIQNSGGLNPDIKGGVLNELSQEYQLLIQAYRDSLFKKQKDNKITKEDYQNSMGLIYKVAYEFILKNPNNYFSLSEVLYYKNVLSKSELNLYFDQIPKELKESPNGKVLKKIIEEKILMEGDEIFNIVGENLEGKTVKLSDFKGKYVLLDFWASWCEPCITKIKNEFPILLKRHPKNQLVIVSLSFDVDRGMWENESKKLGIDWTNLSNLTSMNKSEIATVYGVNQLPTSFIISPKGIILKRLEYEDDLVKELGKVFAEKE
ncbi:redoxin domain-containing protein [Winogradskyella sp.]|uniref:redoxin domain-containing protein n=1 Tax=Winogradskyella sp. TaxID=1883156 RepID=UPI003AB75335